MKRRHRYEGQDTTGEGSRTNGGQCLGRSFSPRRAPVGNGIQFTEGDKFNEMGNGSKKRERGITHATVETVKKLARLRRHFLKAFSGLSTQTNAFPFPLVQMTKTFLPVWIRLKVMIIIGPSTYGTHYLSIKVWFLGLEFVMGAGRCVWR
jgi:hypothetical protein